MAILVSRAQLGKFYTKGQEFIRDKQNSAYFMLVLSFFALSFFGTFAMRPTVKTIIELERQISDGLDVHKKLQEKNKNLLTLQEEYKRIENDIPIILAAFPSQVDAPNFILKLRTLAVLANLQIKTIQVSKSPLFKEGANNTLAAPFSFTASGKYEDINRFLVDISVLDRIVTFDNIEVTPSSGLPGQNLFILQLGGKIYSLFN